MVYDISVMDFMDRLQSLSIKVDVALTREFLVDEMCQLFTFEGIHKSND